MSNAFKYSVGGIGVLVCLFLVMLAPVVGVSQEWKQIGSEDPMLVDLRSTLANTESIQGDIRQERSFAFLTERLVSTGRFVFKKEDRLRWEFTDPMDYVILIQGSSMRLREEGVEKEYNGVNRILRQVKEIILGCIDGSIIDSRSYQTNFLTDGSSIRIQLQPKSRRLQQFVGSVMIEFEGKAGVLKKLALTDSSGDVTDVYFSELLFNESVDGGLFTDF